MCYLCVSMVIRKIHSRAWQLSTTTIYPPSDYSLLRSRCSFCTWTSLSSSISLNWPIMAPSFLDLSLSLVFEERSVQLWLRDCQGPIRDDSRTPTFERNHHLFPAANTTDFGMPLALVTFLWIMSYQMNQCQNLKCASCHMERSTYTMLLAKASREKTELFLCKRSQRTTIIRNIQFSVMVGNTELYPWLLLFLDNKILQQDRILSLYSWQLAQLWAHSISSSCKKLAYLAIPLLVRLCWWSFLLRLILIEIPIISWLL